MMNKIHPICLYGTYGSGKTSFIAEIARFLGVKARIYTAEHYETVQDSIDDNVVQVFKFNNRAHPFETLRACADGYWPEETVNGIATPDAPLKAPDASVFEEFPIRVYEGLGTCARYLVSNHANGGLLDRASKGDILGPTMEHIQFADGDANIAGMCWTHYNIAQNEIVGLVQRSQKKPGIVIWTSHEDDGKERKGALPVMGPEVIGSAVSATIGREFADVWHIALSPTDYPQDDGTVRRITERRLYMKDHVLTEGGLVYKSKNSAGLRVQDKVPDYVSMSKNGLPLLDAPARLFTILNMRKAV